MTAAKASLLSCNSWAAIGQLASHKRCYKRSISFLQGLFIAVL